LALNGRLDSGESRSKIPKSAEVMQAWLGTRNMKQTGSTECMEAALLKNNHPSQLNLEP
jgi:hypothetical protein